MIKKITPLKFFLFPVLSVLNFSPAVADEIKAKPILLHAARVFDGNEIKTDTSVLINNGKVIKIDSRKSFSDTDAQVIELGDSTLLPGFIELHAHLTYKAVPADTVLRHGITTLRDVGGPLHKAYGGDGNLRILSSGKTITSVGGYPIPNMGAENIAIPVENEKQAREAVQELIKGGAVFIKVSLEPGGEAGAPWLFAHKHHPVKSDPHHSKHPNIEQEANLHHKTDNSSPHHVPTTSNAWPLLSEEIVKAIVDEAHKHQIKVTAHVGEQQGAEISINAGVDEWSHVPCAKISEAVLKQAVTQKIKIVTTIDTLSKCSGIFYNSETLAKYGAEFLYGAEIAHPDVPWGIDAQELMYMVQKAKMKPIEVLRAATSKSGKYLGFPLLGTLQPEAPADIIAVKGNPLHAFKSLEYPDLVISGGKVIVNNFKP